jgi:tetratricopeptide (TPR) repeat protein
LIDNAVFGGDLAKAVEYLTPLRGKIDGLPADVRVEAHQVMIEAAMRLDDLALAKASLQALREAQCPLPVILSFEAQIHWFAGDLPAARTVFEALLVRHADYCQGITIENDLAVVYFALGELGAAEAMAQRSLKSWAGVAHTEALSLLVLGATLTSLARFEEAAAALDRAELLGRAQGSARFVGEAQVRRAMLLWALGQDQAAQRCALSARATCGQTVEALRRSAVDLAIVLGGGARKDGLAMEASGRLAELVEGARHPLALVRCWRGIGAAAEAAGDRRRALQAARRQEAVAACSGLAEWRCEALWRIARQAGGAEAEGARAEALALAHSMGFGCLLQRFEANEARRHARG